VCHTKTISSDVQTESHVEKKNNSKEEIEKIKK